MIWLEIFGYVGTALVLASMMMTKLTLLRIFNVCGSVISAIYSYISGAMPVVILNVGLIAINVFHLIREERGKRRFKVSSVNADSSELSGFLIKNSEDIARRFPERGLNITDESVIYMVYSGNDPIGLFVGREDGNLIRMSFGYSVPGYKYGEVVVRFMAELNDKGYASAGSEILLPFKKKI